MNEVDAVLDTSRYCDEPHLVVLVDGEPLDELLAQAVERDDLAGLVLTLGNALYEPTESQLAWSRIAASRQPTVAPLLICPDCGAFDCTVVVAEVRRTDAGVEWTRFGLDVSGGDRQIPRSTTDWFRASPAFRFPQADYERFLDRCRALEPWRPL